MVGIGLADLEDDQLRGRQGGPLDQEKAGEARDLRLARRVVDVEIGLAFEGWIEGHAEQTLFAAESHRIGQIENPELPNLSVLFNEPCDRPALLGDQERTVGEYEHLDRLVELVAIEDRRHGQAELTRFGRCLLLGRFV